ncbi:cob(I)yrinic acid a,c-diamide adenosyltransferase [Anaerosacchariphilus polymeriproducens]|uniref:Cob(I)yrinic acid a,c-diamide adenosyltransferase n=1 Tax=Anaerosacchariphilus polymeriproducens TaxID=1812858 RepID=A0A371ATT0_9FIRM|nr:cob(I)yrinic acid a,c-diamide adenosyltransferase [Anaerosacchariphilus polymeriproducens]RDU22971.1 cob(I)yrinic acid a,c-diamide adenosyltransferase [Anaerosacchariphilus polymeriproducens]
MKQGCIHIYCGEGKGKTTASLGLAIRAAGSGMKVIIVQFLKGRKTSELNSLEKLSNIRVIRNSKDFGFFHSLSQEEIHEITAMHTQNLKMAIEKVVSDECDLLILDELCAAYGNSLVDKNIVKDFILNKPKQLELVITGRNPDNLFIEHADYISEIKKVKHPYDKKISARKGIEY